MNNIGNCVLVFIAWNYLEWPHKIKLNDRKNNRFRELGIRIRYWFGLNLKASTKIFSNSLFSYEFVNRKPKQLGEGGWGQ